MNNQIQEPTTGRLLQDQVATTESHNPNPWVIVTNPGADDEGIWADFPTYREAVTALSQADEGADIMKRLNDGTLTTEY